MVQEKVSERVKSLAGQSERWKFDPREFRTFCLAGKGSNVGLQRILDDFKHYLNSRELPSYVKPPSGTQAGGSGGGA